MTRVYLPVGLDGLNRLHFVGRLEPGLEGYAPTARVRELLEDLDAEELDHALATAAAEVDLDRGETRSAATRRVVLVADVDEHVVREETEPPGSVTVSAAVERRQVAAVLVGPVIRGEGVHTTTTADSEPAWFATQEIADLLA